VTSVIGDDPARIEVQPDGPYVVYGSVPLSRRRTVVSEHDEPMTTRTTRRFQPRQTMALCRCGGSTHKPFCDGTHSGNGFDGTESAPTDDYDVRAKTYEGARVVVRDDRSICEHAGFCGNQHSNVWKMVGGTDTDDSVLRAHMIAMIERCPSGALTYRVDGDDTDIEPDFGTAIAVTDDGPLFVTGGVPVVRSDGEAFETRNRVTLCRCGQSAKKPLCDGSHKEAGFTDS
jgi:CDGSH-type Zn-finger protein